VTFDFSNKFGRRATRFKFMVHCCTLCLPILITSQHLACATEETAKDRSSFAKSGGKNYKSCDKVVSGSATSSWLRGP
jgi:hypothetical protein